jgi:hypothetical protein
MTPVPADKPTVVVLVPAAACLLLSRLPKIHEVDLGMGQPEAALVRSAMRARDVKRYVSRTQDVDDLNERDGELSIHSFDEGIDAGFLDDPLALLGVLREGVMTACICRESRDPDACFSVLIPGVAWRPEIQRRAFVETDDYPPRLVADDPDAIVT